MLRAEGGQLRAQHRYCDLAVECVETGDHHTAATIAIPLDALADFEGAADTPVVIEAVAPDRTIVRWEDRGIPQSREYNLITPVDRLEPMPASPATWASNPAGLLDALAEAAETSTPDSNRYALECIQLQGNRGQVVATDGRQLLVRSGYSLPWTEELLIKARPIFACRALPRDQPVEVGRTDTHVFVRVGPWTISCAIQADLRFPAVDRLIPAAGEIGTRLRLDPADARFLESALDRLTGDHEINSPVTMDLNGKVAVRVAASDQPDHITELVLSRSSYSGSPLCLQLNRNLLGRALRLGYTELGFTGIDTAFLCRDSARIYAVQPLGCGSRPGADAEVTHIESGATGGREGRVASRPETTRRTTTVRESRNGHEPAPATEDRNHAVARSAEAVSTAGNEQPGTSLAVLMQEAESLHAALADAKSRTARLIAGLRRQRKQSRLVNETLKSLRQLKLVEAAG